MGIDAIEVIDRQDIKGFVDLPRGLDKDDSVPATGSPRLEAGRVREGNHKVNRAIVELRLRLVTKFRVYQELI